MKFNVIDSIMGSGKTVWAFNFMYKEIGKKFIYVTPYLDEIERLLYIRDENGNVVKSEGGHNVGTKWYYKRKFREPKHLGEGKLHSLHGLLKSGFNIATTHALFKMCTEETLKLIKQGKYTLVLDEALDIVEIMDDLKTKDYEMMLDSGKLRVDEDRTLSWTDPDYDGKFWEFRRKCENGTVVEIKKGNRYVQLLVWNFNFRLFNAFEKVYIMTYLFDSSLLKYYFDIHGVKYKKWCIENKKLVEYEYKKPYDKSWLRKLINVYQGRLNDIGERRTALNVNWHKNYSKQRYKVRNNIYNYFRHIAQANSSQALWTTFKSSQKALSSKGYKGCFAPCNIRATNDYIHKTALAYCVNRYLNPEYIDYFLEYGIKVDQDMFALSEMIQWIWRSAIRDGKPINIYIPSRRMRELLIWWLNNENI